MSVTFDIGRMLEHMRVLCKELSPRTPAGPGERKAAEYVAGVLHQMGIKDVMLHSYKGISTLGLPATIAALIGIFGFLLGWLGGKIGMWLGGALLFLSAYTIRNLLRTVPPFFQPLITRREGRNVIATVPARQTPRKRIFILAHLDANKQRFTFPPSNPALMKPMETASVLLMAFAGLSFWLQALLGWSTFFWFQVISLTILLIVLIGLLADEFQPTVEGANDNASAVVVALALAENLLSQPLLQSEVTFLFTGCEETGHHGLQAYLNEYRPSKKGTYWIDLELVGAGQLCFATRHGISYLTEYEPSREMLELAEETARVHPSLGVIGRPMLILEEVSTLRNYGYSALCLMGYNQQGYLPHWHRLSDTMENIEPEMLKRTALFVWELLQTIDRK
ncbi:MAG: M28 family metallopeptidase [Anaerolineales bacterium]|nr:M28 family metallopeptidase [Anaerolineales bacterium]MCX7608967.1 M28 family metallopeptidase [Anaerolineales bacterium]